MRRLVPVVVVAVLLAAGCSSGGGDRDGDDAAGSGEDPATATTMPGVTGTVPAGDLPLSSVTTVEAELPPVEPLAKPTGVGEDGELSAARLEGCVTGGSCREIEAPLVIWPGAQLAGLDLSFAVLTGVDLRGADLSGANLTSANLSGANLAGAKLDGATLADVNLTGASLTLASVRGTDLRGADLRDAIIDRASFQASIFCQTVWVDGTRLNDLC
ncbi:pentapeptide repeat-containing protein [Rhabdothermincola sediminis]|uniref:pentapeptide repeat-containing protein n=1 Tax=Rhabdothermincola sediminis TaxID=2751370 RepID=UPI001AA04A4B|nr:pentapeptide repeat-containing protein [Rhabdothermincola sediminis]